MVWFLEVTNNRLWHFRLANVFLSIKVVLLVAPRQDLESSTVSRSEKRNDRIFLMEALDTLRCYFGAITSH